MSKNRIEEKLAQLKEQNEKAFITYLTAGLPDMEQTKAIIRAQEAAGTDIVEIGVPFSDPIAEGPVIQCASERSLRNGTTLVGIFDLVRRLRKETDVPLLLMMYLNTIFRFGTDRFFALCEECGIDGVIVPDIPFEEKDEIQGSADAHNVHNISLVTPASEDRIQMIASEATGFLYCVSSNGVTGVRSQFQTDFAPFFEKIHKYAKIPCAVGFGISGPEAAKEMSQYCDGVIVGSAVVRLVEQYGSDAPKEIGAFTKSLRDALDA